MGWSHDTTGAGMNKRPARAETDEKGLKEDVKGENGLSWALIDSRVAN